MSSPGAPARLLRDLGRQVTKANAGGVGQDDRPFDGMLQLAHIAWPAIVHQRGHRIGRDGPDVLLHPRGRADQETVNERRNVLPPLAQRRHLDDEGAEPEIQILPKRSGLDGRTQIAIGRGHDAGVDLDVALTADAPNLALLQSPEQLRLDGGRDFADFVEEDACRCRRLRRGRPCRAPHR